jgi:hypothetical protein
VVVQANQPLLAAAPPSATAEVGATATAIVTAITPVVPVAGGGGGTSLLQQAADLEMAFSVVPGLAGLNNLNFYVRDMDRDDRPYTRLLVHITYLEAAQSSRAAEPVQLHEGHWPLDGYELAPSGRWRVDAVVSREGLPDANFSFELRLAHR